MSFYVYCGVVPRSYVTGVLRLIHLDIRDRGLHVEDIREWNRSRPQFEHLRGSTEITAIAQRFLIPLLSPPGTMCLPQIVWHLPDRAPADLRPWGHVDVPPEGKAYTLIAGVALTDWSADNGGLHIWIDNSDDRVECSDLWPGDVVAMSPDQKHSPGINRTGDIRVGLYYRWQKEVSATE